MRQRRFKLKQVFSWACIYIYYKSLTKKIVKCSGVSLKFMKSLEFSRNLYRQYCSLFYYKIMNLWYTMIYEISLVFALLTVAGFNPVCSISKSHRRNHTPYLFLYFIIFICFRLSYIQRILQFDSRSICKHVLHSSLKVIIEANYDGERFISYIHLGFFTYLDSVQYTDHVCNDIKYLELAN